MYAIVDIETTGNTYRGNRVTEIAIFRHDGNRVVDEYTTLVNPECDIPFYITALTGIDNTMVATAPTFSEVADKVISMTQDAVFVAHSVNFDFNVIRYELEQLQLPFQRKKLCTVRLSRKLFPGLPSYSLGKLCSSLNISLQDRHRAKGDAAATVTLFERLLGQPNADEVFRSFVKANSRQATLPPLLDKKVVNDLPEKPGVYYFINSAGTTIYVGKAKNLKKRVLQHFYDRSNKETQMCREIAHIHYELSGSELVALLMESAAIKKLFPRYNAAQKRKGKAFGIFAYEDRKGIMHLGYNPLKHVTRPLAICYSQRECMLLLKELCHDHQLCPKYCQLQKVSCPSHDKMTTCRGICTSKEDASAYNERVLEAIGSMALQKEDLVIKEKGRTADEEAVVIIKQGIYMGYGFVERSASITSQTDLEAFLIPQLDNQDVQSILQSYLRQHQKIQVPI